jgi:excisionase family DNA binding protein
MTPRASRVLDGSLPAEPTPGELLDALLDQIAPAVADRVAELLVERLAGAVPVAASPWLDVAEAAEYLRCKPKRIYDLGSQERLPVHRDGGRLLFRADELDRYLEGADTPLTHPPDSALQSRSRRGGRMPIPGVNGAR